MLTGNRKNPTTMKTKEIKEQLEMMYNFYEADAQLCAMADMNYDWECVSNRGTKQSLRD